ncbi:protein of unknown function [Methylocella tundrae]|uniref:Uncharacterized protein n=1 Tax=Methylocella tundrae TaxID=227605 RepID=A0A4U8YVX1_METTU|nr:protein of unknown function [Methylocella tundrae]
MRCIQVHGVYSPKPFIICIRICTKPLYQSMSLFYEAIELA